MGIPLVTIDANGLTVPTFDSVLTWLQEQYRAIYGSDVVLTADTQDGEWLGILAAAFNDCNAMAASVYQAFSPSTAQGVGLSRVVKINGIARAVATYSAVDVAVVGQAGTVITGGVVSDAVTGERWDLPATVTIPYAGTITVTATAQSLGAVQATSGAITKIETPTYGWQSVTNALAAVPGVPVETDAALRRRQTTSTALPSRTVLEGALGAVAAVQGVSRYTVYENDTDITDGNGIPSHSLAFVVEGGDATTIAKAIFAKKGPGPGTYGTTAITVTDLYGVARQVRFYRPTDVPITYTISLRAMAGYTAYIQDQIKQALADWTNGLAIGADVLITRAFVPANLSNSVAGGTFEILSLQIARDGNAPAGSDIAIAFNEAAAGSVGNVLISVVP